MIRRVLTTLIVAGLALAAVPASAHTHRTAGAAHARSAMAKPASTQPAPTKWYLRRDGGSSTCGSTWLGKKKAANNAECGVVTQGALTVLGGTPAGGPAGAGPTTEDYAVNDTDLPLVIHAGTVSGVIYMQGFDDLPSPNVTITVTLNADDEVGQATVSGSILAPGDTAFPFSFQVPTSMVGKSRDVMDLSISIDQAENPTITDMNGSGTQSYVLVP